MSVRLHAVELNKPNETITEFLVGIDDEPDRAEDDALEQAAERAINRDFEIKVVIMDVGDGDYYCRMLIEHKIYVEPTQTKNQQATIGYGSDIKRSLEDAKAKAEALIAKTYKNISRINEQKDERAQSRNRADTQAYWLKSVAFEKFGSTWTCIIKFEYLKDKDVD